MRPGDGGGSTQSPVGGAAAPANELLRWREASMDPSALPARAADLADAARDVPGLAPLTLMRIYSNVTAGAPGRARTRGVPLGLRVAMLASLLLVSVATAKGAMVLWHRYVAPAAPAPRAPGPAHQKLALAGPRRRVETVPVIEVIDEQEQQDGPPVQAAPAPSPARAPVATRARRTAVPAPAPEAPVAPADPVNEAQLLTDALRRLRQGHDPRGALALLDQYERTYPRGVLTAESRSARLEATLKLGDRSGALALLDDRATFAGRLGAEQLLTRAELRASVGRYADALADFDRVLAPSAGLGAPQPAALERALYGRAVTLGHLGQDARARADLEAYQLRFPSGKFAGEVARLLRGAPAGGSSLPP